MVVRLLMIVAAAVVLLSSGFSCYTHGKTDQDADMDTKVRRDTLQSLANASALLDVDIRWKSQQAVLVFR